MRGQDDSCNCMSFLTSRAVVLQVQSVTSGSTASASSENLLEMPIFGPYPIPIESESLGPSKQLFSKSPRWFWWLPTSEKHALELWIPWLPWQLQQLHILLKQPTRQAHVWCWSGPEHLDKRGKLFLPLHLSKSFTFTDKNLEAQKKCECGGATQGHTVSCGNENGLSLSRVPCTFLTVAQDVGSIDEG